MISLPDLLRRFRRAWAPPGAAHAVVAPPADPLARLRAEIQPVLDAIADIQRRAQVELAEADASCKERLEAAKRQGHEAVRDAERRVPDARSGAAEEKNHAVDAEIAAILADGRAQARRIATEATARLPALVAAVRSCVQGGAGIV